MEIMNTEQFYIRMEQLLKYNKWTIYKLSQESGVPLSTMYNLRRRKSEPKMETLFRIIEGFHISVDEFKNVNYIPKTYTGQQMTLMELTQNLEDGELNRIIAYTQAIIDSKENKEK